MQFVIETTKFRKGLEVVKKGQVLGVAEDDEGGLWVELAGITVGVGRTSAPPMVMHVTQRGPSVWVTHICKTLANGTGLCYHPAVAVGLLRVRLGLEFVPDKSVRVSVDVKKPTIPDKLRDLTVTLTERSYRGTELFPSLESIEQPPQFDFGPEESIDSRTDSSFAPTITAPSRASIEADAIAERRKYLQREGLPKPLIDKVLGAYRPLEDVPEEVRDRIPKEPIFTGDSNTLNLACLAFVLGKNLFAVGPKGTGKTALIHTLAWIFGLPLFEISGSLQTEVADMRGDKTLDLDENSGQPVVRYELGVVAEAMKHGGLAYIDEFPNIREGVAIWLNGLDWRRAVEIPGYGVIKAHPRFRLALGGNKGYAGTFEPNEATVDRCVVLNMQPMVDVASLIRRAAPGLPATVVSNLAELHRRIVSQVEAGQIRTSAPISIRGIIDAAQMIEMGGDLISHRQILRACILEKIWDEDFPQDREAVAQTIDALFAS